MLVIVDYGAGNLGSIQNMLLKVGATSVISADESVINSASKLLLPGIGAFDNCMEKFNGSGLRDIMETKVNKEKTPLMGICVGLQMLMENSEEGEMDGLGWIGGKVVAFDKQKMAEQHKVPNMGWLEVKTVKDSKLTTALTDARFYFAHSFHVVVDNPADKLLVAEYGYEFVAAIERDNIIGVQFHPEKSHRFGMQLLKNFVTNF